MDSRCHTMKQSDDVCQYFYADGCWVDGGWLSDVRIGLDSTGVVVSALTGHPPETGDIRAGWLIPAMPNAHSHVFQRAMAGQAEYRLSGHDDFWSWRTRMYALAEVIDADTLYDLACWTYAEMLAKGYCAVCEFHYLHRGRFDEKDATAMSKAVMAAAAHVGMRLTLLPVLYRRGGFGNEPVNSAQQRFVLPVDEYLHLLESLHAEAGSQQRIGICFHSLRAVSEADMHTVLASAPSDWPVHVHIAEQRAEVEQCLQFRGQRPVSWLLDHFEVSSRWSLVHATHMDESEIRRVARSGAVVALCPSTEANLGDGVFPLPGYQAAGGRFSLGSDSNVELNPARECQLLEYSQRLLHQRRVVAGGTRRECPDRAVHAGDVLWREAVNGGRQSLDGRVCNNGLIGQCADWLELDEAHPLLRQAGETARMDSFIFAAPDAVKRIWRAGRCVAEGGETLQASTYRQQGITALRVLSRRLRG